MINILKSLNFYQLLNDSITIFAYLMIILGIWFLFKDNIVRLIKSIKGQRRFRINDKKASKNPIIKHIETITTVVYNSKNPIHIYTFTIITVFLFLFVFIVTYRQTSMNFAFVFSLLFSLVPYGYLQLRLRTIRVSGSHEAEGLLAELINQYKINYFNMIEAIDKSIPFLKDYPFTREILSRLSFAVKDYKTEEELQEALKEFIYAINTEWITMLANNIYLAVYDGYDVTSALEDILNELKDSKLALEDGKRANNEGFTIMITLIPLFYIGSIFLAVKYFNFTLSKFLNYQLNTPIGFKYFLVIISLTIFNIGAMIFYKRQKFDI